MNIVIYNLMNKINEPRIIDGEYLENLYQYYECHMNVCNCKIEISKSEFKEIITEIYNVLRLKISEDDFKNIIIKHYINLLIADSKDKYTVDCKWFIDKMWYLSVGISECDTEIYKDCIPFIQQTLMKKFNLQEKLSDKIKRKISTGFLKR